MLFDEITVVLDPDPHGAALNMSIDEVLLHRARGPLLRVYRWERPALSFGYFGKYEEIERAWRDRELVRRWTGGGLVPHGNDLTYTLVVPRDHAFCRLSARESYRRVHEQIADLLRGEGWEVMVAGSARAKISEACFENAAEFDVLAGNHKIAGAAQRRTRWGLLHQGSIQLSGPSANLAARLPETFGRVCGGRLITGEELAAAEQLAVAKYGSNAWLRRF